MDATTKLATFLRSAANGELDQVPTAAGQALRFIFAVKPALLRELEAAPAGDVDHALEETARLALSLRSDELPELVTIESTALENLIDRRRVLDDKLGRPAGELADIERDRGGIVLGVDY